MGESERPSTEGACSPNVKKEYTLDVGLVFLDIISGSPCAHYRLGESLSACVQVRSTNAVSQLIESLVQ
jgi:hypothetical protein